VGRHLCPAWYLGETALDTHLENAMTTTPAGTGPILIGYDGSADAGGAATQHVHRLVLLVPSPALAAAQATARTAASALAPS